MDNARFIFKISRCEADRLTDVSRALEARCERMSRERCPALWKLTDQLNSLPRDSGRSKTQRKIMSIAAIALGIFLLVPGIAEPRELLVPLIVGIAALVIGIFGLLAGRPKSRRRFDAAAKKLLSGREDIADGSVSVTFDKGSMAVTSSDNRNEIVDYGKFECIIEAGDIFLAVFDTRVMILQKRELSGGSVDAFRKFASGKIARFVSV